ncbi:hypothetical protein [Bacteroides acidifaciens]|nr:hypothetical protein [Bacteroides acidifaciens]
MKNRCETEINIIHACLENYTSGTKHTMDACQAQGVETLHGLPMEVL